MTEKERKNQRKSFFLKKKDEGGEEGRGVPFTYFVDHLLDAYA